MIPPDESIDFSGLLYLDNAATTWPKPAEVLEEAVSFYRNYGVNPGRSGSDIGRVAATLIDDTRARLATLFGAPHPDRVIFTPNATDALNLVFSGCLKRGDHVVTSELDHNSVLRPLGELVHRRGIALSIVPASPEGFVDPAAVRAAITDATRMVAITHASNVLGTVQAIGEIGAIAREKGILFVIDAAQTAGVLDIDMQAVGADALVFTGHKSLLAPPGTGGVCLSERIEPEPFRCGGTGFNSLDPLQPRKLPYRLEAGTHNLLGIAGLAASLNYLQRQGIASIHAREMGLLAELHAGLAAISRVNLLGSTDLSRRVAVLAFTVEGMEPERVGVLLDVDHGIVCRTGLHCSPLLHRRLGTSPNGAVRFSIGPFTTEADIERAITAVRSITRG